MCSHFPSDVRKRLIAFIASKIDHDQYVINLSLDMSLFISPSLSLTYISLIFISYPFRPDNLFTQLPLQLDSDSTTSQDILLINRLIQGHIYLVQSGCLHDVLRDMAVCDVVEKLFSNALSIFCKSQLNEDSNSSCVLPPLHSHTVELLLRLGLDLNENVSICGGSYYFI